MGVVKSFSVVLWTSIKGIVDRDPSSAAKIYKKKEVTLKRFYKNYC